MNRDVYGADVHFYNTVNLVVGNIGEGDIVAKKEGHTGVVILKIKSVAHTLGHLVDKAKYTLVFAAALLIHQVGIKLKTDVVVFILFDNSLFHLAVALKGNFKTLFAHKETIIKHILNFVAVDSIDNIPCFYALFVSQGALDNVGYIN